MRGARSGEDRSRSSHGLRRRPSRLLAVVAASALAALLLAGCAPAVAGIPGTTNGTAQLVPAPGIAGPTVPGASSEAGTPPSVPSAAVDDAFVVGDGPIDVELWVDYFCPYCGAFEATNGDFLQQLVDGHQATLHIHPIAILDRASMGTKYSTRAANAAACVAQYAPGDYFAYHRALYAAQPEEGTPGLGDADLAGLAPAAAQSCISGEWFDGWVGDATKAAIAAGVQGTPWVVVDGRQYQPTGGSTPYGDFRAFVLGQSGAGVA